jgi:hypothetical protein
MKLKLRNVVAGLPALQSMSSIEMSIQLAFTLQRTMRLLAPDYEEYEKARVMLIKEKYGSKTKEGNFEVIPDNMEKFQIEMDDLLRSEIDLDIKPIFIKDAVELKISPIQFDALEWLFIDDTNTTEPSARE